MEMKTGPSRKKKMIDIVPEKLLYMVYSKSVFKLNIIKRENSLRKALVVEINVNPNGY